MRSQGDETNRFQAAAEDARRNFEEARHRFEETGARIEPYLRKAEGVLSGVRGWCSNHLPGGERTMWVALGLILLVVFVWAILPGNGGGNQGGFGTGGPQPVGVAVAAKGDIEITLDALGTVTPIATVTVRPQVSGQLVRVDFLEGHVVKAGDLLAEIDPRTFRAALDQAKGQLARDQAALVNARLDQKRQQALFAASATSQQALDTQEAQVKQDEGVVSADRASVESAAVNLGYTRIVSPVAGLAGLRQVDVGNFVAAGQATGIVVVTQFEPISVLFTVPEDNIDTIVSRLRSGAQLAVTAYDRSQTTILATGKLLAVDSQVDTTTGTVKMRALFDNKNGVLFPNQFVNVRLLVDTLHGQIVVPASAIQRGSQGAYVFVVKADHTVAMRAVTLGPQQGDRVSVVKGLNPRETVVTDGGDRLRDGDEVTIPGGQKVAAVAPPKDASAPPESTQSSRRNRNFTVMRKLSADECTKIHAMSREDRSAWIKDHREEVMQRPDQPGGGCKFGGGGGIGTRGSAGN
ncbi:MAG: MdtA/MuxA family multidrug efflux RND transporter periplasmic adaptor subunit [Alphaproteobacteria bacterium]|nr:MdtA/MuxA family multidrug efflux RND transporter periplasmic adaptor subunit [Alphaproteobacteria bacterium]MDE2630178.1 MdtA/MuxA family multidrug efflux RND transporter periplasmic adaptor subunit [Alphaproteobacteria bacterium]